jgi:signal transduction protein with GAF and PtsI domain
VQYTLAVDRGNVNLANRFTALHPAVLRLIKRIVDVADAQGIDVAVCGEMASQPLMAFALIGLGVRELSVNPRAVSTTKRLVRGISTALAREAASAGGSDSPGCRAGTAFPPCGGPGERCPPGSQLGVWN